MLKKVLSTFMIGISLSSVSLAQERPQIKFEKYELENGLKVILHEDHNTPIVTVSVMYHVGGKDSPKGKSGFAHFFEHLLFEGSENIKRGEFMKIVEKAGGTLNANTTQDRTYYYETLPANQLELGLWLESERMLHPKIDSTGVNTQRKVVKEEKRTRYDKPYMSFQEHIHSNAFAGYPYQNTNIGSMEDLDNSGLENFKSFFRHYYVPKNAILSIAGDISLEETKELVSNYFSTIPKGEKAIPRTEKIRKVIIGEEIRKTIYDNIQLPAVIIGYRTPHQNAQDTYALYMLNSYLSSGKSSLLYKKVKEEKQLAINVGSFPNFMEDAGLLVNFGIVNSGVSTDDLEKAINEEIAYVQNNLMVQKDLEKLKNKVEMSFISSYASVKGISENLANYEMYQGDANLINTDIENYLKVTASDIQRVAKKYLVKENRVVLTYLPMSEKPVLEENQK